MRQMLLTTFSAAALAMLGIAGAATDAEAYERRGSRSSEYISVDLYPHGSITYANHHRDRYYGDRHYRDRHYRDRYYYDRPYYWDRPPYGHAHGYWKKHHRKHWKRHHRHHRDCWH